MKFKLTIVSFRIFALLCCCLLPLPSYALTGLQQAKTVISLAIGVNFPSDFNDGKTLHAGSSFYDYTMAKNKSNTGLFEVFIGEEMRINQQFKSQLGLAYYYTQLSARGTLTQGVDIPSSDTYNYQYDVQSKQLLLEGKLYSTTLAHFYPYLTLGLGAGWNNAKNYHVNNPIFMSFSPQFANHDETVFAYMVGIGFDTDITCHVRLGLGYRYRQIGKASLGNGTVDTTPIMGTLSATSIHTYEILGQLTYIFA